MHDAPVHKIEDRAYCRIHEKELVHVKGLFSVVKLRVIFNYYFCFVCSKSCQHLISKRTWEICQINENEDSLIIYSLLGKRGISMHHNEPKPYNCSKPENNKSHSPSIC